MKNLFAAACAIVLFSAAASNAATIQPSSYNMRNGDSGTFHYWDDSYSGRGDNTLDSARLRRGLGDLTDGVIATENWSKVEGLAGGPYVGWRDRTQRIVFKFDRAYYFSSATFHFDSNGGGGGVNAPRKVIVNGQKESVVAPGADPFAFTFDMEDFEATDRLVVRIRRARTSSWTFLSEVTFDGDVPAVPLPASGLLLLCAVSGMGVFSRKKNRK